MDDDLLRLEAVLGKFPDHRALPDLELLFEEAGVTAGVLADERAHKLVLDALTTRPHGELDGVRTVSTEVELLVLEVRELTAVLRAGQPDRAELARIDERLDWARRRLAELQDEL